MLDEKQKLNLLKLLFDPTLISEEEALQYLKEDGYDVERIERKRKEALERLEKFKIQILAEKKKKIFNEVISENSNADINSKEDSYRSAARNGKEQVDINNDSALLDKLKEKNI